MGVVSAYSDGFVPDFHRFPYSLTCISTLKLNIHLTVLILALFSRCVNKVVIGFGNAEAESEFLYIIYSCGCLKSIFSFRVYLFGEVFNVPCKIRFSPHFSTFPREVSRERREGAEKQHYGQYR